MFTTNHYIWLALSLAIILTACLWLQKRRPPLNQVLTVACVVCIASELVKVFSSVQMVPSADGSLLLPYLEMQHLPLHLCSMQIIFIFYARFAPDSPRRTALLAFMYPTCVAGALLALAMPSIFSNSVDVAHAFAYPLTYQYFLYHSMLIILGWYIFASRQVDLRPKHALSTLGFLAVLAFVSLYINSMFADANYVDDVLVSVDYTPNLLFTYQPPLPIPLTQLWHWYVYLAVICVLGIVLVSVFYLPVYLRRKRSR